MGVLAVTTTIQTRPRRRHRINLAYFILVPACLVTLLPFIWMVLSSFKPLAEIRQVPPTFFPNNFTLANYALC